MAARACGMPSASHDGAQDAAFLREPLCVLLEVQAHIENNGAQLERVHALFERLDACVATLEQHCRAGGGAAPSQTLTRLPPAAAARERAPTLLDLSTDMLDKVVAHLDPDDELATALACRKLRDAVRGSKAVNASASRRTLSTRVRSLLGSLGKLRWGVACGAPLSEALFSRVAGRGDLRMLGWLRARGCRWPPAEDGMFAFKNFSGACAEAARGGHMAVLRWLRAIGCPWDTVTCSYAATSGHLSVLQWARANGCPWNESTCSYAAKSGHLSVLQWARTNGCPWNVSTCSYAAEGGHLAVLQWARASGCPWDESTCWRAAEGGHLAVLQWARINGCPWEERS
jgi:hypothetical protein